jgi:hypothetical protein
MPDYIYFHVACFSPVITGLPSHQDQALDCRNIYISAVLPIILCPFLTQGEEEEEKRKRTKKA